MKLFAALIVFSTIANTMGSILGVGFGLGLCLGGFDGLGGFGRGGFVGFGDPLCGLGLQGLVDLNLKEYIKAILKDQTDVVLK